MKEIKSNKEFIEMLQNESVLSLVYFYSLTSVLCKPVSPFLQSLIAKYPTVQCYTLDTQLPETSEIVHACEINNLPTFCFFKNNKYIDRLTGTHLNGLEIIIKKHIIS